MHRNGTKTTEGSFSGNGTIDGINVTASGIAKVIPRNNMTVFIEGNAEFITNDGDKAPYTFQSIGHYNNDGSFRSSGAAFFSGDTTGKLDFLNNIVGIYKDETDERMEMAHSLCGNGSKRRRNINRRTIQIDEA